MKNIHTLVKDIYDVVGKQEAWFDKHVAESFSRDLGTKLIQELAPREERASLRLSQMGPRCPFALWSSVHSPSVQEPLPAPTRIKFTYGHLIESMVLEMARAAGHEVTGEQDVVYFDGIKGHRDCIIDGCLVDVKSASSRHFQKFKTGTIREDDPFGYLDQLDGYLLASVEDDLLRVKDRAYFLVIDKTLGNICTYEHRLREAAYRRRVEEYKRIVGSTTPPECTCGTVPFGKSGNVRLDVKASYNVYKHACAEHRGEKLRTFLYADGPVYLTKVVRRPEPHVVEVDKFGKLVL